MGLHQRTVQRIWQDGQAGGVNNVVSKKPKNYGRKRIEISPEAIKEVPLRQRTTMLDLARALGVSKSTVYARLKEKQIRRHSNTIKSYLTPANKKARMEFAISMLDRSKPHQPTFKDMYNIVHIDEKWFYRTNKVQKFYLAENGVEPERTVKSENFIEKVMFLCATTWPRYDDDGIMTFDGKIGIWGFTFQEEAKRHSLTGSRVHCSLKQWLQLPGMLSVFLW